MNQIISSLFSQSFEHFQNGSFEQAENLIKKVLQLDPKNFDAFQILGIIKASQNNPQEAIKAFESAAKINPLNGGLQFNLAKAYMDCNLHAKAVPVHEKCLKLIPENPDAWINYGASQKNLGNHEKALTAYQKAQDLSPNDPEILANIAVSLNDLGRYTEALDQHNQSILINPNNPTTWYNKGITLEDLGSINEAIKAYEHALTLHPEYSSALSNLGGALIKVKRYTDAIASYEKALSYSPGNFEILANHGSALAEIGQFKAALDSYQKSVAINPEYAKAWFNQGIALHELGRYQDAITSFENAKKISSDMTYLLGNLAFNRATICDWGQREENILEILNQISLGKNPIPPFYSLSILDDEDSQKKIAQLWTQDNLPTKLLDKARGIKTKKEKITIGYFSADFKNHAVSVLLAGLFESHNKNQFETIAFSFGPDSQDDVRKRLIPAFSKFIDIRDYTDQEAAALARDLGVDIAVDLSGFTKNFRMGIFANRAAPIQINYLGFAGTMGAEFIDYIIADKHVIPESSRQHYSEKIIYMPNCFMANDSSRQISSKIPQKSSAGIPEDAFVFCCFNNSYKITPTTFEIWMSILKKVEGSVLWLSATNLPAQESLLNSAKLAGVDPGRIIFADMVEANEDHLARLRIADLFLDTLPYNAHTTAADALWAGVPVLTCTGTSFAGRVAGSLLRAIDLPELVTEDYGSYEMLAIELAKSPEKLRAIKNRLQENKFRSPLFDTQKFTLSLEKAYRTIYEKWLGDQDPTTLYIE